MNNLNLLTTCKGVSPFWLRLFIFDDGGPLTEQSRLSHTLAFLSRFLLVGVDRFSSLETEEALNWFLLDGLPNDEGVFNTLVSE